MEALEDRALLSYSVIDLGALSGGWNQATDINAVGQVVGNSSIANGGEHAFLWQKGVMIDLGTLGGNLSRAYAINDAGQVVGQSAMASGAYRAFLFTPEDTDANGTPDRWFRDVNADGANADSKNEATETFYLDLFGLSGNALFTKNPTIGGMLKTVDADKRTITIAIPKSRDEVDEKTLPLSKDARVMLDGKETNLGDLKPGENGPFIHLRLTLDQQAVQSASAFEPRPR